MPLQATYTGALAGLVHETVYDSRHKRFKQWKRSDILAQFPNSEVYRLNLFFYPLDFLRDVFLIPVDKADGKNPDKGDKSVLWKVSGVNPRTGKEYEHKQLYRKFTQWQDSQVNKVYNTGDFIARAKATVSYEMKLEDGSFSRVVEYAILEGDKAYTQSEKVVKLNGAVIEKLHQATPHGTSPVFLSIERWMQSFL